ncbi:MAG TPA: hypothetical protein VJR92_04710 [Gemmatimonadaceae bacterium]|nr:hypothetical protein [Gemmatimonadaceae bacterium]
MKRFALGLIAALAVTSLEMQAQSSRSDSARSIGTATAVANAADSAGLRANAPGQAANTLRIAGAPLLTPALSRFGAAGLPGGPATPPRGSERRGTKFMFIGVGLLLTGAIVDDDAGDVLTIGGLFFSLYGLWIFLN